jgi:tight adherence protein C
MTLVPLLACACLVASVAVAARRLAAQRRLRLAVERASALVLPAPVAAPPSASTPLVARLARLTLALRPGASRDELSLRLAGAGLGRKVTPELFLGAQGALLLVSVVLGLMTFAAGSHVNGLMLGLAGAGCALVAPDRLLAARTARRREAILAELPGALDLLAVAVEAGLGFDAAVGRVADATTGPLADELSTMLSELRYGEARATALQRLSARSGSDEIAQFARAVARADQLGTSLAGTLRIQAADARTRRQLAAEEKANKAPVKMLFPTIVFIFPALFVVVLGPAVLSLGSFLK